MFNFLKTNDNLEKQCESEAAKDLAEIAMRGLILKYLRTDTENKTNKLLHIGFFSALCEAMVSHGLESFIIKPLDYPTVTDLVGTYRLDMKKGYIEIKRID